MLAVEILNHPLVNLIGWTLLHFLWQGAIVGVIVAALLAGLRRRNASVRYVVGIVGLAAMAACPLITMATHPVPGQDCHVGASREGDHRFFQSL
jgi:hypothetical protein